MSQPSSKASTEKVFQSYYLQRSAQEFAEDLDKVRNADDFKTDSIQYLVHALGQGAMQFSHSDQRRVVSASGQASKEA